MRAFIISILVFALAGAAISGLLLYQHYVPQTEFGMFACGSELVNPCRILTRSGFDTILGFPIAGLGLMAYLFMAIAAVITMMSGESRYPACFAVLLPVTALSVVMDIVLGSVLLHLGLACRLCLATYAINIMTGIALFFWYLRMTDDHEGLRAIYRDLAHYLRASENRPVVASFTFILVFMFLFIVFFSFYMAAGAGGGASSQARISRFKEYFYSRGVEKLSLPQSAMSIGAPDADIRIIVFTDFLCPACYRFYEVEKSLLSRFWRHIRVDYYSFPLDNVCNMHAPGTTFPNACVAAGAFMVAADRGMFRELLEYHFEHYTDNIARFNRGDSLATVRRYFGKRSPDVYDDFVRAALSERIKLMLNQDVELGAGLEVKAVPTLFVNGRRLEGVPDAVLLESVLSEQLETRRP
jgi:hypothetical protein